LYARALVNAGTHEWAGRCDQAEELLDALADLSWIEVRVLRAAWERLVRVEPEPSLFSAKEVAAALSDLALSEEEVRAYPLGLQRHGFTEISTMTLGSGAGNFRLTSLVDRLMELIFSRE
jgi:hypothetical protein